MLQNSANNKNVAKYNSVISENLTTTSGVQNKKGHKTNNKGKEVKERRKKLAKKRIETQREKHEKFMKNFSNKQLSDSLLALFLQGSNFSPTPVTDTNYIRRQLLLDLQHFARRMRLKDTMDFVNCGTVTKRKLTCSLDKLTTSILQLNLRPKFQRTRQAIITTVQHMSFL